MAITLSTAGRNAAVAAVGSLLNGGVLRLLTSGGSTVVDIPFAATAFGAPATGTITANAMPETAVATAGTVATYEARSTTGAVITGTVTDKAGNGDLKLDSVSLVVGQPVRISSFTYTMPAA